MSGFWKRRSTWVVAYLLVQCVVAFVLPAVLVNAPWPSFSGVGSDLGSWEYISIAGPIVVFVLCLQGGLVAPMTTDLSGEARDQSKGPGAVRILVSALALASVFCLPIGYIIMVAGETFPRTRIPGLSYDIVPALTLLGSVLVAGALVPVLRERWRRGIPIRTSVLIAGLITGLLVAVVACTVVQIILLISSRSGSAAVGYALLAAPIAGWIVATPLLLAFVRKSHHVEPMDRIIGLLFRGTVIEAVAVIPLDVIVRRQRSCYCLEPSFWSLLMLAAVGTVALGPMLIFIAGRKNRRAITGRCTGCGYDLAGLLASVCPECGRPTTLAQPRRADP